MAKDKAGKLEDLQLRNAKPKEKEYTLPDGNGLQLAIRPDGRMVWEIRYTLHGKARKTTAGSYPTVSLAKARAKRDELKSNVNNFIDKVEEKKKAAATKNAEIEFQQIEEIRNTNTFEKVTRDFIQSIERENSPRYHTLKLARLENHIFPYIGSVPIDQVTRMMIIECMDKITAVGKIETAIRVLGLISQMYRYAVTREIVPHNITSDIEKRYVIGKKEERHFPTITEPKRVGELMRAIDEYHGEITVRHALKLATLTAQRPYNIRFAEWSEFDLEKNVWSIPADKMKMKRPHIVPITSQLKAVLEELAPLTKHKSIYLFPSLTSNTRPISENTLNQALRRLGYSKEEIVSHGFRAMFSTIANEHILEHGYPEKAIELHLAHAEKNKIKGAYDHAQHMKARQGLAIWWADYLDEVKAVKND
jgi:integrase